MCTICSATAAALPCLLTQNRENLFVTAFVAVLNTKTGELCYCNAGHTWPVLLKEDPEFLVPDCGVVLGMFEDADLQDYTLRLSGNDGIMLYTDGVTEAVSPERTFFGKERLLDALRGIPASENKAEEAVLRISRAVYSFCDGNEPFDDMAVLALYFCPASSVWISLPVSLSAFEKRSRVRRCR